MNWEAKSNFAITCNFIEASRGEVSGGPLKIGLDSSNFVGEFLGWFRFCRHLNQVSSSILAHMVDKTWFFLYGVSKIQVSSITSERIDPNSWLRCLQKRNHPRNSLTKFEDSSPILRGPPETSPKLVSMNLRQNSYRWTHIAWSAIEGVGIWTPNFVGWSSSLRRSFCRV